MTHRKEPARLRIQDGDYHRNGISGAPFHVFLFDDIDDENARKLGVLFGAPHHCAVLDVTKLSAGIIGFGFNSYRGDHFEVALRSAVKFPNNSGRRHV